VVDEVRPNLFEGFAQLEKQGRVLVKEEVDVKNLLELGRVVIERKALDWFEKKRGVKVP